MAVEGALLSGFINVVFDRLISPGALNLIRGKNLDQQLVERLKNALCAADVLLLDAEQKQITNPSVKQWLDSLRDAVYVADDLLDRFFTQAATQKEVTTFLPRFLNFRDREIANKMEEVVARIEHIEKRRYVLGLKEIRRENLSWRIPSTSLEKGIVYGRKDDQDAIIQILNENIENEVSVIPIVGIGGVGKTTLAQWMYNNEDLMKEFDLKAWVCVSEEFDIIKITKTIIETVTSGVCNLNDLNLLQLELKQKLSKKKFFVVLDDVWSHDYDSWTSLKAPFQYGFNGSKILVTTRSEKVASVVQTRPPHHLNHLSDEHCWSIFANHACFPNSNGNPTLEKIGREIAKKCKGLPLAAQTLGGLLRTKHETKDWSAILTSEIWEISENDSKIIPALRISYYHLPPHLKRCFAYCSLFPKDYEFHKDELILLWMAEDLLEQSRRGKTLEEAGSECFDELASRLFFKRYEDDDDQLFVMHDLMHDLAISVAGDFYFRSEELGKEEKIKIYTRHMSFGRLSHPISSDLVPIDELTSLRTFLPINFSTPCFSLESTALIIISNFECLRVLSFWDFSELYVLPDSIGKLIHLRYLDLCHTSIKTLPESLSNLQNLQTLKLNDCYKLTMLPSGMQNLVNLRYLDITGTKLEEMPPGMSNLKQLQLLSDFVVGKHEENGIKELGELSNLHGPLCISKLENVANSGEAGEARIMDKTGIQDLTLEWSRNNDIGMTSTQTEREIFDKLQPHTGLQVLAIYNYRGTIFPDWVGHSSYHNMTRVSLNACGNCCMLPSLGQLPSLKSLEISDLYVLETIGADADHSSIVTHFPSLEYLSFYKMSCWEKWHCPESYSFPKLKELYIFNCPMLKGDLPNHLPALERLGIARCERLASDLPRAPSIQSLSIRETNKVGFQVLPNSLQSLSIGGNELVESVLGAMTITQLSCLRYLSIEDCLSTTSFPNSCLSECLKELEIRYRGKLEFPIQKELVESAIIQNSSDSLISFPLEVFPNLNQLTIKACENVGSLSVSQSHVSALLFLRIDSCPNFVGFPRDGLTAPSMTQLELLRCDKLKSLPCHMNTLLPKLASLWIENCPEIDSFPDGGLPPNLASLQIINCEKLLRNLSSMGAHDGLTSLSIGGALSECMTSSFPKEGLLPQLPSLETLELRGFKTLETLDCNGLLHLTSLKTLEIRDCPKLENVAGERLPPSLIKLEISKCSLLGKRRQEKHVDIWPKVSHVCRIRVDGRWIS